MSDRCGGLEASKKDQLCIYRCHAGLTDFSIPLVIAGHLVGFVLCGQVRLSNDVELVDILNVDDRWQDDPALVQAGALAARWQNEEGAALYRRASLR